MTSSIAWTYIAGLAAYGATWIVALLWITVFGGNATFRGPFGLRLAIGSFVMFCTYVALWQDNGVTERTSDFVEVAWSRYAGYIPMIAVVGANASAFMLHVMDEGWSQMVMLVVEFTLLLFSVLALTSTARYVFYGLACAVGIFAWVGYYWGAQLRMMPGGRMRALTVWVMLGVCMAGLMVVALLDSPLVAVWGPGELLPVILFLVFDFLLLVGTTVAELILAVPAPGQQAALAMKGPKAQ